MSAESADEISGIAIVNPVRDQLDLQIGVQQQRPPALQAHLLQIFVGAHPDLLAEDARESLLSGAKRTLDDYRSSTSFNAIPIDIAFCLKL